jgi:hypothetical protein
VSVCMRCSARRRTSPARKRRHLPPPLPFLPLPVVRRVREHGERAREITVCLHHRT